MPDPRTDPHVVRRLTALAVPAAAPAVTTTARGWTPAAPDPAQVATAAPHGPPAPATGGPGAAGAAAAGEVGPAPDGGARAADDAWEPSVRSALADAAARDDAGVPLPRVRWTPGWRTTGAAVTVLALAAGALVLRSSAAPVGDPVVLPSPVAPVAAGPAPDDPPPEAAGEADTPSGDVVVHVVGAVASPGVVRLPLGARVGDAILAVGGSGPDADLTGVNLARVVSDGEQVLVPVVGAAAPEQPVPEAPPGGGPAVDGLLDLNSADESALQELPGVGPVLAARIVQHRQERPFTTVDELDDVPGIGPALMADLRPRVRV